jgi:DtxR family Mn-dependent transcriptional regulator
VDECLTPALEDYLEVILQLSEENGKAKISDIARRLKIAKPSANQAIANLRREGLVYQERYGPVFLTDKGRVKANEVWDRHQVISRYLREVLKVSPLVAEHDACMMEHVLSPETLAKMTVYLPEKQPAKNNHSSAVCLTDILTGQKVKILQLTGKEHKIKQRLMEMGLIPGTIIQVERLAPLGDPVEIRVKGYLISLRRDEASSLLVELIES